MIQKGHIKKDTINFDQKSNLAKLLATENITVQHDQVKTASFNLEDRILTIPIFKNPKGAVYDMLVGHEVSHALHTPQKDWIDALKKDDLMKIKDYINVIEDIRIDKLIQKKYPGLVNDYRDGFHILWNDNFFGCKDKDLNKELMLIDKINLYFKSSKTLDIKFSNADKLFVNLVDKCKTFKDVIEAAKKLSDWQKKENEKLQKLPDFDSHPLTLSYGEKQKGDKENEDEGSSPSDKSEDKSDIEKAIEEANAIKADIDKENSEDNEKSGSADKDTKDDNKDKKELETTSRKKQSGNPDGAGGKNVKINMPMKSITQNSSDEKISKNYLDKGHRGYSYMNITDCNLDKIIYPMKDWVKSGMKSARNESSTSFNANWEDYKRFKKDSERTITYLVKEFEMKKSADGYKRTVQDKTGIIDPLKLHRYKTDEDIFKRLSIIPDAKNHGMILVLDWSGSMANVIGKTVEQLLQLIWFCQRINIPYKVYFFSDKITDGSWSERRDIAKKEMMTNWNFKSGDMVLEAFNMVEIASHGAKKQELDQSLFLLYSYSKYYDDNYNWRSQKEYITRLYPPYEFQLSSTPLNETLAAMYKIIPKFKQKYQVDKLSLITLTDGHSNNSNTTKWLTAKEGSESQVSGLDKSDSDWGSVPVIKLGSKYLKAPSNEYDRCGTTGLLLEGLKRKFNMTTIGFYLLKRTQRYEFERYAFGMKQRELPYSLREELYHKKRAEFTKNKSCSVKQDGYTDFFLINAKTMKVENTDLNELKDDSKKGEIKRIFGKSMKARTVSRILLSKFIKRVA